MHLAKSVPRDRIEYNSGKVPVGVKLTADARTDRELLARLAVRGGRGPVRLGNVATLAMDSGPAQISREAVRRRIDPEGRFSNQYLERVLGPIST